MKGITHFAAGVALASCFPQAVEAGAQGHPLYFLLGGILGLLPDTLDFKFYKFFYRRDMEVTPDPRRPDPEMIANAIAYAVERSHKTKRPVRIKLNTIRLGADLWQRYTVKLDAVERRLRVAYGPKVNTGRRPVAEQEPRDEPLAAEASLPCPIAFDYQAVTEVDILDGPTFLVAPREHGGVEVSLIPWHRQWSHSLVVAAGFGLLVGLIWGLIAGLIAGGAYAAHIATDQLGFMGSNLFFPFTRRRVSGWQRFHSQDALSNFSFVWAALVLVFGNLYRSAPLAHRWNFVQIMLLGGVLPLGVLWLVRSCFVAPKLRGHFRVAAVCCRAANGRQRSAVPTHTPRQPRKSNWTGLTGC